jgi:hypothetical protein
MLDGGFGVKVNLVSLPADLTVPSQVDDVPVITEIVGPITPL